MNQLAVCLSCRLASDPEPQRAGLRLFRRLHRGSDADLDVVGVDCLGACTRPCVFTLQAEGKFSWVFGGFTPDDASEIYACAALYCASPDGSMPKAQRPERIRTGLIARLSILR